jgi:hypothetical protein
MICTLKPIFVSESALGSERIIHHHSWLVRLYESQTPVPVSLVWQFHGDEVKRSCRKNWKSATVVVGREKG